MAFLSPRSCRGQGSLTEELSSRTSAEHQTSSILPDCSLSYDSIALRIAKMSGDEMMYIYIPDFSAHIEAHPDITNFTQFLDVHEQELGGPAPRLELMLLDMPEDEGEVDPVLDPLRDVAELMEECARGLRKNSDVTVEQIIGCIPVGVHIEIRMAVVVRDDFYTLKSYPDPGLHFDGPLVFDTGNCRGLRRSIVFHSWQGLFMTFSAWALQNHQFPGGIFSGDWTLVKTLPHTIADMVYEFQGRIESLALLRFSYSTPVNLLEAMLEIFQSSFYITLQQVFFVGEQMVNPVLVALGDALDEFKSAVLNKNLLLLVNWEARKFRTDLFPGESWKDFVTRVGARAVG